MLSVPAFEGPSALSSASANPPEHCSHRRGVLACTALSPSRVHVRSERTDVRGYPPPCPQGQYEATLTATDSTGAQAACLSVSIQIESAAASGGAGAVSAGAVVPAGAGEDGAAAVRTDEEERHGAGRAAARLGRRGGSGARGLRWAWEQLSGIIVHGLADIRGEEAAAEGPAAAEQR